MRKKLLIFIFSLMCVFCLVVGLTACDSNSDTDNKQDTEQTGDTENSGGTHTHNYTYVETQAATCTESGILTYTCTICGDTFTVYEKAKGHTLSEAVNENFVEATCVKTGSYDSVVYCSVCHEEISREKVTVPKLSHEYSAEWHFDETGHWHACTVDENCGEMSDYAKHTFDDGERLSDGSYLYTCEECSYQETSTSEDYRLTLTSMGGTALSGIDVDLYTAAGKFVASDTTGRSGYIRFKNLASGTYIAYVDTDTLPLGYYLDDNQVELTADNKSVTLKVASSVITSAEMPSGTKYTTGSVVYDFTVTCMNTDGSTYEATLTDYINQYNAVFLNFFYTGCSPCRAEMPYMEEAYEDYADKVGLICFDYTGNGDTETLMCSFKSTYSLTFDFTLDTGNYYSCYSVTAYPTTVVIDRYGCVALIDTGSNVSTVAWTSMFEYYTAENYNPTYSSGKPDLTSGSTLVEATVEMPSSEEIAETIVTTNDYTTKETFTFSNYSENGVVDVYNWSWIIGESEKEGVSNYIRTSNQGRVGGYSILVIDVSLTAGQAVLFDYFVSCEEDYDLFYVQVDTVLQATYSGNGSGWETCLAYVAKYSGKYQITLYYQKDSSNNYNDDTIYVSNLRIVDSAELIMATYCNDVLYNAATNYTTEETVNGVAVSEYGEGYGYINYVDVYLASDGYYHVGSKEDGADPEEDPFLLADIYYGTPWYAEMSIWYEVYVIGTDINDTLSSISSQVSGTIYDAFENYAWVQNSCPWGYIPVNEELHAMLVAFVSTYGRQTGTYAYENQWLELCRYYVHYGADHSSGDKCYSTENIAETYGIKYAKDIGVVAADINIDADSAVVFTAEIEAALLPRGNYYKFTVNTSGIYRVYSCDYQTDADLAPYAFILDANQQMLDESEEDELAAITDFKRENYSSSETSYDFAMYIYLVEGEVYYLGCTFSSLQQTGSYDVGIYYLGTTFSYFTTLTTGAYYTYAESTDSNNNTTYTYYLPTRVGQGKYAYNTTEDCWYTLDASNNYDQPIYIDLIGTTWFNFYSSYTIEQAAAANDTLGVWNNSQLYSLKKYIEAATTNPDTITVNYGGEDLTLTLTGCYKATAELVNLVNILVNGDDTTSSSTYASNAWMLTAYYLRVVE